MKQKITTLIIILIISTFSLTVIANTQNLKVHFIDVDQADSSLIQLPNNQTMLIDAGNNTDGSLITNYIKKLGIKKIDYLIGTHPHEDHIGGLDDIISKFQIGNIYMPNVTHTSQTYKDVLTAIKLKNKKIKTAKAGLKLLEDNSLNLEVKLVGPTQNHYTKLNNYSAVTKVKYNNTSVLFTGDAEAKAEHQMINSKADIKADILKVGHHGSHSSTSKLFLKKVKPKYAILSVDKHNKYNHPSQKIISRLKNNNTNIYRTDQQRTIIATSNGNKIDFNTKPIDYSKKTTTNSKPNIKISDLSLSKEVVTIANKSNKQINISHWKLVSDTGNQTFVFPKKTTLAAGETLKVISGRGKTPGPNTILWTKRYIWNNDGDSAKLYNSNGQLISTHY
ncbi:MBL fold metallo-hydrolase [Halanaerobaculum tunisiense]